MSQMDTWVNENGTKVAKPANDPEAHEDATTILVRSDGQALTYDSLDDLIRELKLDMVSVGAEEYNEHTIVSQERDVSITEIQREFLAEDWSDHLPPKY